jgi:hypothetical protein
MPFLLLPSFFGLGFAALSLSLIVGHLSGLKPMAILFLMVAGMASIEKNGSLHFRSMKSAFSLLAQVLLLYENTLMHMKNQRKLYLIYVRLAGLKSVYLINIFGSTPVVDNNSFKRNDFNKRAHILIT